jgi:FixJ family two-component response regulator
MPPERRLIAVIDDDASFRKCLERLLRATGYRCESFASAEEFLLVASLSRATCVISDIGLDGISGLELALHPKIIDLRLPVILITGSSDPMYEIPAREIGAAFLRKPFTSDQLLEALVDTVGPPIADGEQ